MELRGFLGKIFRILKEAFSELQQHDPLVLSSSLAFFTLFSLPPILIILMNILGWIFKEKIISGEIYNTLTQIFGDESSKLIEGIIQNFQSFGSGLTVTILGSLFLIFIGTTTFSVIHKALNQIWQVKQKPKSNFVGMLKERVISLGIIIFSGILFLASLLLETFIAIIKDYITDVLPKLSNYPIAAINHLTSAIVVIIWFGVIFKFLPNIKIPWKPIWVGAIFTGLLFSLGKYVLGVLLINSNISTIYGAAGSMVLILLFLFYSAMILLYGVSFTKTYALSLDYKVTPRHYAVVYEINEVEKDANF